MSLINLQPASYFLQVYNMTYGTSHPRPYVLFGPPGTGKTATVVEAIKQGGNSIEMV